MTLSIFSFAFCSVSPNFNYMYIYVSVYLNMCMCVPLETRRGNPKLPNMGVGNHSSALEEHTVVLTILSSPFFNFFIAVCIFM